MMALMGLERLEGELNIYDEKISEYLEKFNKVLEIKTKAEAGKEVDSILVINNNPLADKFITEVNKDGYTELISLADLIKMKQTLTDLLVIIEITLNRRNYLDEMIELLEADYRQTINYESDDTIVARYTTLCHIIHSLKNIGKTCECILASMPQTREFGRLEKLREYFSKINDVMWFRTDYYYFFKSSSYYIMNLIDLTGIYYYIIKNRYETYPITEDHLVNEIELEFFNKEDVNNTRFLSNELYMFKSYMKVVVNTINSFFEMKSHNFKIDEVIGIGDQPIINDKKIDIFIKYCKLFLYIVNIDSTGDNYKLITYTKMKQIKTLIGILTQIASLSFVLVNPKYCDDTNTKITNRSKYDISCQLFEFVFKLIAGDDDIPEIMNKNKKFKADHFEYDDDEYTDVRQDLLDKQFIISKDLEFGPIQIKLDEKTEKAYKEEYDLQ